MRKLILAGAALAFAAAPVALAEQQQQQQQQPGGPESQTADEANAQVQPASPRTTVTPAPGSPPATGPDGPAAANPSPGAPVTVTTTYPGNLTPPPPSALNKTYPVCTRTLQDSCRNPGGR